MDAPLLILPPRHRVRIPGLQRESVIASGYIISSIILRKISERISAWAAEDAFGIVRLRLIFLK